jgi:hypothetical protein
MASNVNVQFSASIKDLIEATNSVKGAIDSVAETANKATATLKGFAEFAGVALSVAGIKAFISSEAELGEQIERTSKMLGISTKSTQELGFIAKATGGDAESMALAMERLQLNLAKAATGAGPAAAALKALGINAKSLIGVPIDQQMNRIADAFAKFGDGPNKTAVAMELFGRAGAQMIPVLDEGHQGLDKLRETAEKTGSIITERAVKALADLQVKTVTLKSALSGLAGEFVGMHAGISGFTEDLAKSVGNLTAMIATGTLGEYINELLSRSYAILALRVKEATTAISDFFTKAKWSDIGDDIEKIEKEISAVALAEIANLDAIIARAKDGYHSLLNDLNNPPGGGKPPMPAIDVTNGKDAIKALQEQYQTMIKVADEAFTQTKEKLSEQFKTHQITYDQETTALLAALDKRHAAENAAVDGELLLYARGTSQYQKAIDERLKLDAKYKADHQKIVDAAVIEDQKEWMSILTPVQSAWDSQLKGLLAGTETWATAMKRIAGDLVMDIIKALEKLALEKAALGLTNLFGGPSSMLGGLTSALGIGGGGAQAAATTANTTAVGALTAAIAANTAALTGETVATTAEITATTAQTGAAGASAASGLAALFAPLAAMFGFAAGTDRIMNTGIAVVHKGETIVPPPAQGNGRFTGAGFGSAAPEMHLHVHAIDTQTGAEFIQKNMRDIARGLQGHWQLNSGDRPRGW